MCVMLNSRRKVSEIYFVVDQNTRDVGCTDIDQHLVDFRDLLITLGAGRIDHM